MVSSNNNNSGSSAASTLSSSTSSMSVPIPATSSGEKVSHRFTELLSYTLKLLQVKGGDESQRDEEWWMVVKLEFVLILYIQQAERDLAMDLLDAANFDDVFSDLIEPTLDILTHLM